MPEPFRPERVGTDTTNTVRRVNRAGGLIGIWKTQHHVMSDQIRDMNLAGYRVTFVVQDSWTLVQWIGAILLLLITIGIYTKSPGFLIIGEKI